MRALGAVAVERREQLEVLAARSVGVEARRLDEARDALERPRAAAQRIAPEQLDRPSVGMIRPSAMRSVVVLPAPLGPRKPYTSPRAHVQVDVVDRQDLVVALDQSPRPDRRGPARAARRLACAASCAGRPSRYRPRATASMSRRHGADQQVAHAGALEAEQRAELRAELGRVGAVDLHLRQAFGRRWRRRLGAAWACFRSRRTWQTAVCRGS